MRPSILTLSILLLQACESLPKSRVELNITAETPAFEHAAAQYRALWKREGTRIVAAMQRRAGLTFEEHRIDVIVFEGMSWSGRGSEPMRLRASYPEPTKRATLIHELGHRLQAKLCRAGDDNHAGLFLWLYDVWVDLYGVEFANQQVAVESARRGFYDYESAWRRVLELDAATRARNWRELRESRL